MSPRLCRRIVLAAAAVFFSVAVMAATGAQPAATTLTVLYDNSAFQPACTAGWGFSALIQGAGPTILFDAGAEEPVFLKNVDALKVNLNATDLVFISHDHGDHTGGLAAVLRKKPGLPVYVAASAQRGFQDQLAAAGARVVAVTDQQTLAPGVLSTGDLGDTIHEEALLLDTPRGLVVVTGCAHPGIVSILERAKAVGKKNLWMVLGGFHLYETAPADVEKIIGRFKELGVQRVGATHCTGDAAIGMFRRAFGQNFVEMGVGRKIDLGTR